MTSYSPRYRGATKQGKTAVCPRFTSNSLLAGFLCLEPGWGCPSPGCPSSPQPPRLASWSFWDAPWLKASIFLERLLLWLPARPLVSREISFFSQGGAGLILLSEGRALLSLLTLEDPRLWASLASSPGPFVIVSFFLGKPCSGRRAFQPPYSGSV